MCDHIQEVEARLVEKFGDSGSGEVAVSVMAFVYVDFGNSCKASTGLPVFFCPICGDPLSEQL
jgi:hypothetical protein